MTRQHQQHQHNPHHPHREHRRPAGALATLRDRVGRASLALAVLALAAIVTASWPVDRAAAVTDGTIGIRPATESDFFRLSLYPGAATEAVAIVSNQSAEPVTLLIYPVDGEGTPQGTFAFGAQADERAGVGAWVDLDVEQITVPARSEIPVPFLLSVPEGTPPGDYAGGLIIQAPPVEGETTELGDGTALRLDIVQRQGLRIYLDVAGVAIQQLDRGELTWKKSGDSITFSLPVHNTGNTILHPTGTLDVSGWIGANESLEFSAPESVLPDGSYTMTAELPSAPFVHWGRAQAKLGSEAGVSRVGIDFVLVPWELLAALLAVLVVGGLLVWRTARFVRRARRAIAQVETAQPPRRSREPGASADHDAEPQLSRRR